MAGRKDLALASTNWLQRQAEPSEAVQASAMPPRPSRIVLSGVMCPGSGPKGVQTTQIGLGLLQQQRKQALLLVVNKGGCICNRFCGCPILVVVSMLSGSRILGRARKRCGNVRAFAAFAVQYWTCDAQAYLGYSDGRIAERTRARRCPCWALGFMLRALQTDRYGQGGQPRKVISRAKDDTMSRSQAY
ncbi:uncharacterized protein B0I36DRAFT_353751 [Microdochium trichocladiopsis]|uniref:Uncharacterized protein n=1 Tax=Microdochium trichocladiopsis TaxID=1682393 RepID=A0A9P8XVP3_9PEZI|nr:uncharacterized protein B0I36DRAFT_353751 [Microdochium trichocladiopsis]KAH7021033.1 hypothetical protein B0I36DRAFT_353751 [Microdochium trichocladiopsis]